MISRLAELDLIIKQTQCDLRETLALIDRLREHYLQIQDRLGDAEREHALLLTKAVPVSDESNLMAEFRDQPGHGPARRELFA